jgi:hypothetical protein
MNQIFPYSRIHPVLNLSHQAVNRIAHNQSFNPLANPLSFISLAQDVRL